MCDKEKEFCEDPLDMEVFANPTKEYRGAPFWAWNCRLDKDKLDRQISCFKKMGFGGYHIHPRQGIATEYLSPEYMDYISFCIKNGKEKDMYSYLYDEDRWPSGYAGGLVTKEPRFRQRVLIITTDEQLLSGVETDMETAVAEGRPYLVGCYDIEFDKKGFLKTYKRIEVSDRAEHEKYYAYSRTDRLTGRYNFQTYVDIMQPEAIKRFIELTHKRLYENFGDEYGKSIPSIFSDEPRHETLEQLSESQPQLGALYYWTYGFEESFQKKYGYSFVENLPYLVWDTPDKDHCYVRYHYFNHAEDLFEHAFFKQISKVTKEQRLAFTGHLMHEHELLLQIKRTGDVMRLYPYFDIPGIDVLFDRLELSTAKQTQSVVRQYGKKAMLSELYGVTGWDFDFKCLKMQGDWQAALGVTLRVPHLSMMSMEGRAKRDYPASFNYQSPWCEEYKYIEDHFARLNTVLSRGKAVVNVAVLHPIETTMLRCSTKEKSAAFLEQQEKNFQNVISWLLYSAIDFDFLNEALLPVQDISCNKKFRVGQMEYDVVVIPPIDTIRETTLDILEDFSRQGGRIIFMDKCPQYVDGKISDRAKTLYERSGHSGFGKTALTELLEEERMIYLQNADGTDTDNLIYQLREDGDCRWLFVAQAKKLGKSSYERSVLTSKDIMVTVKGEYHVLIFDTLTGEVRPAEYCIKDGKTVIRYGLFANDSLLLKLTKEQILAETPKKEEKKAGEIILWDEVSYKRSEPNVVLFDVGRYSLDGKIYSNKEYVLEMNQQIADVFHITYSDAQPYLFKESREAHTVYVRFEFESEAEIDEVSLAAERMKECTISLNGAVVDCLISGYYVDESIQTVKLPTIRKGRNILDIKMPFSAAANIEPCYLLGEFDVTLKGCDPVLHKPADKIGFAPLAAQGMPFYGGNITYSTEIDTPECTVRIIVSDFGAPCVRVFVDEEDAGLIAFAPFAVEKKISAGRHRIELRCYGNRNNTFGPVHNRRMNDMDYYIEPTAWEKECEDWRSSCFLQNTGILSGPVIEFMDVN